MPRSPTRAIGALLVLVLGAGCGSAELSRALEEGQRHYQARRWERAIERVESGLRAARAQEPHVDRYGTYESQIRDARLLIARAYRRWGRAAEALANFDSVAVVRGDVDPDLEDERRRMTAELWASVSGPASSRLRLVHRALIPNWLHLQAVEYAVDDRVVFARSRSEGQLDLPNPGLAAEVPLAPGAHYLRLHFVCGAHPYRFHVQRREIIRLSEGETLAISPLLIDRGAKGKSLDENLDIQIDERRYPPPAPTTAGSGE